MIIHGIEIKPGMILCGSRKDRHITLVVIPYGTNSVAFVNVPNGGWSLYYTTYFSNIEEIRECPTNGNLKGSKILWQKQKEIVVSIDQIREKFKIPKNTKIIIQN